MICRVSHGWTTPEPADRYEALLRDEIFVHVEAGAIAGYRGIGLLPRPAGETVELVTLM